MKNKYAWFSAIIAAIILLDQLTKQLVVRSFNLHESVRIIPGFFDLTYVRNPGAAFGFLAGAPGVWRSIFFITVSIVALAVIVALVRQTRDRLSLIALSLIGGGAVGNLIDRIRFGEVVDFIDWYYRAFHWPTFNIADSAITIGVGLLAIDMLLPKKQLTAEDAEERQRLHHE
ncbi:MAG: signal peptidase II [Nitrospirota bacterium]